jgi:peptidoglycan/xylan/chitin deacetylase (PgdA/CDA1 family)
MRTSLKAPTARPAFGMLSVLLLLGAVATAWAGGAETGTAGTAAADSARLDAFWARATQEIYKSPAELSAQRARELRKGLGYDVLARGDRRTKTVALTFDDGPHPQFTPQLLAILKQYDVNATFFVVGEMAEKAPDMIRAEQSAGHVVGNHTYHHVNLTKIPVDEVRTEWQACQDVVKSITGETMRFCRPPGGDYDDIVIKAAMATGLTTVLWTDDPGDYASPGDSVIEGRVLDRIGAGGIILLHDGIQQTIDVLPQIIEHLQHNGYRFLTIAEMQAARAGASAGQMSGPSLSRH